jgi:hypothetical protein
MKHSILLIALLLLSTYTKSQNLISNPSFEENGEPSCEGWYDGCGGKLLCDTTNAGCGTFIIPNTESDSIFGRWSLRVYGSIPESGIGITYITGQTGTNVYQLKFWMNTETFIGEVYIGPMKNGQFTDYNYLVDFGQPWTQYTLLDTITTTATDTIGVWLSAGLGDFCICEVSYDQIELTIIDSLMTAVEPELLQNDVSIFPNPFENHFTIHFEGQSGFSINVFDLNGKNIKTENTSTEELDIDLAGFPSGIYFYKIASDGNRNLSYGKLIKR